MSQNIIFVLMYHSHKLLDLVYKLQELTRTCEVHRFLSRERLLRDGQCPHSRLAGLPSSCSGTPQEDLQMNGSILFHLLVLYRSK
jgi:hypothetical protein